MFSSSKKSNGGGKPVQGATTIIAPGTVIRGDVSFNGIIIVQGRVEGTLRAESDNARLTRMSVRTLGSGRSGLLKLNAANMVVTVSAA